MTDLIKQMKNNSYLISHISYLVLILFPSTSFAQGFFGGINDMLKSFGGLLKLAIPIVVGLAVLFFFWGVALYVFRAGDEKQAKEGKSIMIYGVIALFVMFSIWGIIKFIGGNLGIATPAGSSSSSNSVDPNEFAPGFHY